jgi:hypothetical protein
MSSSPTFDPGNPADPAAEVALEVSDLSAAEVLDALAVQCRGVDRAEADKLALVVHYVDLHPVTDSHRAACWDLNDGLGNPDTRARVEVPLAGIGTPGIADYALEALGPVLEMGYRATKAYVAAAVELRFRLPRLWDLVQAGRLQAWRALRVAEATPTLSPDAVGFVDRHVAVIAARNRVPGPGQLRALVHEALLQCDPDTARGREEAALAARDVWFEHTTGSRPTPAGPAPASPTAATGGPARTATTTTRSPSPRPTPATADPRPHHPPPREQTAGRWTDPLVRHDPHPGRTREGVDRAERPTRCATRRGGFGTPVRAAARRRRAPPPPGRPARRAASARGPAEPRSGRPS